MAPNTVQTEGFFPSESKPKKSTPPKKGKTKKGKTKKPKPERTNLSVFALVLAWPEGQKAPVKAEDLWVLTGIKRPREGKPFPFNAGKLCFPGGGITTADTSAFTRLRRECKAETGLTVAALHAQWKTFHDTRDREGVKVALQKAFLVCKVIKGDIKKESAELADLKFRRAGDLLADESDLAPLYRRALKYALQHYLHGFAAGKGWPEVKPADWPHQPEWQTN